MAGELTVTAKMRVASELLEEALRLYFDGKSYFAALHLAGGAEEILGTYVTRTGEQNAFKSLHAAAVRLSAALNPDGKPSDRHEMQGLMNYARNRTKHLNELGDDEIHFDPRIQAKDMLDRAVTNYYTLMAYVPLEEFELLRRFSAEL